MVDSRTELDGDGPEGLTLRPRPRTTRLNRNALLVGAVLGGAVIAAAAMTLVQNKKPLETPESASAAAQEHVDPFWKSEPDGVSARPEAPATPVAPAAAPVEAAKPAAAPAALPVPPPRPDDAQRRRRERKERALEAAPLVAGFEAGAEGAAPARASGVAGVPRGDGHPPMLGALAAAIGPHDATLLQNNQAGKQAFLESAGIADRDETNPHRVRKPLSPFEVTAGMIVPAVLVTQGNSDLPGLMTARVRENVYDSATGRYLLIPQGTTLVGVYDSVVTFGQRRLLVAWQRLLFPDASTLNLGSMPGTEGIGAAGFEDQVNRHTARVFGGAFLLSALTAGTTLSQQGNNGGFAGTQSTRDTVKDTLATALGQNLGQLGNELLRREMNVQPTLRIRPGYRFNVLVNRDLVFEGPYQPTRVGGLVP